MKTSIEKKGKVFIGAGVCVNEDSEMIFNAHLFPYSFFLEFRHSFPCPKIPWVFGAHFLRNSQVKIDFFRTIIDFIPFKQWGKVDYLETDRMTGVTVIRLPEGDYKAKFRFFQARWKRKFWTDEAELCEFTLENSIPMPNGEVKQVRIPSDSVDISDACIAVANSITLERNKLNNGKKWSPKKSKSS